MTTPQQGRRNRTAGHEWERTCARELSTILGIEVVTSRAVSGGAQHGADLMEMTGHGPIPTVHGWSLEAKCEAKERPTAWLRQAKQQSDGRLYAVLSKNARQPFMAASVITTSRVLMLWITGVDNYDGELVWLSMRAFVGLLELPGWTDADVA